MMMNYEKIPQLTIETLERYVKDKIPTGGFLQAVLENNLVQSFGRADTFNMAAMFEIVQYCYWEIPSVCWGSPEKVKNWLQRAET